MGSLSSAVSKRNTNEIQKTLKWISISLQCIVILYFHASNFKTILTKNSEHDGVHDFSFSIMGISTFINLIVYLSVCSIFIQLLYFHSFYYQSPPVMLFFSDYFCVFNIWSVQLFIFLDLLVTVDPKPSKLSKLSRSEAMFPSLQCTIPNFHWVVFFSWAFNRTFIFYTQHSDWKHTYIVCVFNFFIPMQIHCSLS